MTSKDKRYPPLIVGFVMGILFLCSACQPAPAASPVPTIVSTSSLAPSPEPDPTGDCSAVEHLPNDSVEAQQVLEEFIRNFKKERPTEYMGMAILDRVDRLGEWAVIQGSVSGDDGNILSVHRTSQGYQLVEDYLVTPAFAAEEPETRVAQYSSQCAAVAVHLPGGDLVSGTRGAPNRTAACLPARLYGDR